MEIRVNKFVPKTLERLSRNVVCLRVCKKRPAAGTHNRTRKNRPISVHSGVRPILAFFAQLLRGARARDVKTGRKTRSLSDSPIFNC